MDLIQQLEQLRLEWDAYGYDSTSEQRAEAYYGNQMLDDCLEIVWKWLKEKDLLNE